MTQSISVLMIEDSAEDAELIMRKLRRAAFDPDMRRVYTEADYLDALESNPDIILGDYKMPQFNGLRALELLKERHLAIPFILISGSIGDEQAAGAIEQGATDYLLKDRLARLGSAVSHALEENIVRKESQRADEAMRESEHKYRHLFEHLNEAAFLIDSESDRILDTNKCAEYLLGYTRTEILGANDGKIFPLRAPIGAIDASPYNSHVRTKSGSMVPVRISCAPIVLYQRSLVLALIADATEMRQPGCSFARARQDPHWRWTLREWASGNGMLEPIRSFRRGIATRFAEGPQSATNWGHSLVSCIRTTLRMQGTR